MSLQLSLFPPKSSWAPPNTLPSLASQPFIALDLETRDPHLTTKGPGWTTGSGHIAGIAIATGDQSMYFPIEHFGGGNLDKKAVLTWLKENLENYKHTLLFANAAYDLGWLSHYGIHPKCKIRDIQLIEPLLDESRYTYSLDSLAERYLGKTKSEVGLRNAAKIYGVNPKSELWKLPSKFVGEYAEADARLTYDIYFKQLPKIQAEDLDAMVELEHEVLPILIKMAGRGIRVDVEKAIELNDDWQTMENILLKRLGIKSSDLWTTGFLIHMFNKKKIDPPRTAPTKKFPNGQPSFPKEFLRAHPDPDISTVAAVRELSRLREIFIRKRIIDENVGSRVYPHYKQLASDEGGTVTGRLACRYHNIQQIPKRSTTVDAKLIRALYLPEEGERWLSADYDSQEPRLQIHYGIRFGLRGAQEAAEYIAQGKKLYHLVQDAAHCSYNDAKTITLGLTYGMQLPSLSEKLGITKEEAELQVLRPLMDRCPFILQLAEICANAAQKGGYLKTLLGRRRHFNLWQTTQHWNYRREITKRERNGQMDTLYWWFQKAIRPMERAAAEEFFKSKNDTLERADTNKAGNSLIQGSAADQTKAAMVAVYRETGKIPLSQVHDELNFSIPGEKDMPIIKDIMENTVKLELPTLADCSLGDHW